MKKYAYGYMGLLIPVLVFCGWFLPNPLISFALGLGAFAILFPIIDAFSGKDEEKEFEYIATQDNKAYETVASPSLWPLYLLCILNLVNLCIGIYQVTYSEAGLLWLPYSIVVGIGGSVGLTIAHELYHTNRPFEKFLGRVLGIVCCWGHEEIHHLYLHHRDEYVCIPGDGVLARLNQSLYSYAWQVLTVAFIKHSWRIQKQLLSEKGYSTFSIHNFMLISLIASSLIIMLLFLIFGWPAAVFFIGQSASAIFLYCIATYMQHYGLERRKNENGEYEDFTAMNVWSSDSRLGNAVYFNLFKHAHHHLFLNCPYDQLNLVKDGPLMPKCFFVMVLSTLFPPYWYKLMNKEVEAVFKKRDLMNEQGDA